MEIDGGSGAVSCVATRVGCVYVEGGGGLEPSFILINSVVLSPSYACIIVSYYISIIYRSAAMFSRVGRFWSLVASVANDVDGGGGNAV